VLAGTQLDRLGFTRVAKAIALPICRALLLLRIARATMGDMPEGPQPAQPASPDPNWLAVDDLEFPLPAEAIATAPAEPRESAKLMVVRRSTGTIVRHTSVAQLPQLLRAGDLLVLNATRVLQARLEGHRADTGGAVDGLYLQPARGRRWICLLSGKRLKEGTWVDLRTREGMLAPIRLHLLHRVHEKSGAWLVEPIGAGQAGSELLHARDEVVLEAVGHTPLPPYIRAARKRLNENEESAGDRTRYQTTFAPGAQGDQHLGDASDKVGLLHTGSVAAPTAGLHLTPRLLAEAKAKGVHVAEVVLHVGLGTFAPVEVTYLQQHAMHEERCSLSLATREAILATRARGGRVLCVGTTSVRTVESYAALGAAHSPAAPGADGPRADGSRVDGPVDKQLREACSNWPGYVDTRLLIAPGFDYRWTDALLTNFHTPRSTLLALVSAFLGSRGAVRAGDLRSGLAALKELYAEALVQGYRFFSYGDAMVVGEWEE
jgi:S-adenosylmethionine:tRNA ribosyltransferase-isomerase